MRTPLLARILVSSLMVIGSAQAVTPPPPQSPNFMGKPTPPPFMGGLPKAEGCGASKTGVYYEVMKQLSAAVAAKVNMEPRETEGSLDILEHMDKNDGCHVGVVQSDAYLVYRAQHGKSKLKTTTIAQLYKEYVHLVCGKYTKVSAIDGLNIEHTIAIGRPGSGSNLTWQAFKAAMPALRAVSVNEQADPESERTLQRVKSAGNHDLDCLLFVAGVGSDTMNNIDKNAGQLTLLQISNSKITNLTDPLDRKLYEAVSIPAGTYPGLQAGLWTQKATPVVAVTATLLMSAQWAEANPKAAADLAAAGQALAPKIRAQQKQ